MNNLEVLNTTELTYEIENIIKTSQKFLIIMSPYLKINHRLEYIITNINVNTLFIYRDTDDKTLKSLKKNKKITLIKNIHLHAKSYINEQYGIICSLNLYEYSQVNNFELGVKISSRKNHSQYEKLMNEILILLNQENNENNWLVKNTNEYIMRNLYLDILKKKGLSRSNDPDDALYVRICQKVLQKKKFERNELYQDNKKLILRSTSISMDLYNEILSREDI